MESLAQLTALIALVLAVETRHVLVLICDVFERHFIGRPCLLIRLEKMADNIGSCIRPTKHFFEHQETKAKAVSVYEKIF